MGREETEKEANVTVKNLKKNATISRNLEEKEKCTEDLKVDMEEREETEKEANVTVKNLKKNATISRRSVAAAEKKRVKLVAKLDSLQPSLISSEEEINNLKKKVASDEKVITKLRKESESHDR